MARKTKKCPLITGHWSPVVICSPVGECHPPPHHTHTHTHTHTQRCGVGTWEVWGHAVNAHNGKNVVF